MADLRPPIDCYPAYAKNEIDTGSSILIGSERIDIDLGPDEEGKPITLGIYLRKMPGKPRTICLTTITTPDDFLRRRLYRTECHMGDTVNRVEISLEPIDLDARPATEY